MEQLKKDYTFHALKFEEGMEISKSCTKILEDAEKKISILIKSGNVANLLTKPVSIIKYLFAEQCTSVVSIVINFMLVPLTIGYVSAELYGVWLTLSSIMTWLGFLDVGFTQGLKNKLTEAGYDYNIIQKLVNEILK